MEKIKKIQMKAPEKQLYLGIWLSGSLRLLAVLNDNPPKLKDDLDENEDNDYPF